MSTSKRRGHTRRTPSGKRTRVRPHKVSTADTARNLFEASGITRLFSARRGLNRIKNGADRTNEGATALQRFGGGALMLSGAGEIVLWSAGRTGAMLGLVGLAAIFGGIAIVKHGYAPPKAKKPAVRRASTEFGGGKKRTSRPVHRYPDEAAPPARPRRARTVVHDTATYRTPKPGTAISDVDLAAIVGGRGSHLPTERYRDADGTWRWGTRSAAGNSRVLDLDGPPGSA